MKADEVRQLLRLGVLDRNRPADCDLARSLLDQPKETPVTWDGIPEHRNLHGDDGERPKTASDYRRELADWLGSRPEPAPLSPAEYFRDQAERMRRDLPEPEPGEMPPDPFNGIAEAAVAQVEIFRAMTGAGLTEVQALYYLACLVHVGRAMVEGHMLGQLPPEPP